MTIVKNMTCEMYSPIHECIRYLYDNPVDTMPLGKYYIGETGTFVMIQEYKTKRPEECEWESHKKYVDFQFVLSGEEVVYVSELSKMKQGYYDKDIDFLICFGDPKERITLSKGIGIVLMPQDAHMPCLHSNNQPSKIRKAVFKIPVECFGGQKDET